jgi:hypothetical protein
MSRPLEKYRRNAFRVAVFDLMLVALLFLVLFNFPKIGEWSDEVLPEVLIGLPLTWIAHYIGPCLAILVLIAMLFFGNLWLLQSRTNRFFNLED